MTQDELEICPMCFNRTLKSWMDDNEKWHSKCGHCKYDSDNFGTYLVPPRIKNMKYKTRKFDCWYYIGVFFSLFKFLGLIGGFLYFVPLFFKAGPLVFWGGIAAMAISVAVVIYGEKSMERQRVEYLRKTEEELRQKIKESLDSLGGK